MAATFGPQGQDKLVAYENSAGVSSSSYNEQSGVLIKPDAYYDMMLLKMLRQMEFHYSKYAIQKSLPRNYGDTINWRRFKKLEIAPDLGKLIEGKTPEGKKGISGEQITATIAQYGEVMYFTDLVDLQQLDDVRREYTIELGYIAQETLDRIVRDVLVAEGSVYFAGAAANIAALTGSAHRPKIDDFRKIVLGFKKDFVQGVRGASGRYVALISPEVMFALFDDERMHQYMSYGQTNAPLSDGVAIDLFGIRFEEVLNAPVIGSAHDSIVLAEEAYAITKLQGEGNVRVITKGLGSAGVSDPLDQRQSIGYKITGFSAKVLRPESVVNYWSNPVVAGAGVDFTNLSQVAASEIAPTPVGFFQTLKIVGLGTSQTIGGVAANPAGAFPAGVVNEVRLASGKFTVQEAIQAAGYSTNAIFVASEAGGTASVLTGAFGTGTADGTTTLFYHSGN
jgi:N4-gp56 family major capsid protein